VPGLTSRLSDGIDVADVGCGSGHAINLMAAAFPRSRFTGFDFSEAGIAAATVCPGLDRSILAAITHPRTDSPTRPAPRSSLLQAASLTQRLAQSSRGQLSNAQPHPAPMATTRSPVSGVPANEKPFSVLTL